MEFRSGDESAVYSINTPMMVEAPAGSGKTTLLVDKYIAMLIYLTAFRNKSAFDAVKEITALTFTRKAAEEMKDRIRKKIGENFTPAYLDYAVGMINIHETGGSPVPSEPAGMTAAILAQKETLSGAISSASISTIHSFALNILKTHPVETMLDPASSPRGEEISGGDVFITARDALYSSLRKQIDTGSPDLSALIGILGFEKTEEMLEALLVASDSYGYNAVMEMAAAGGYLEYKDGISEREWLSKKVKPELMSLLSGLAAVRPDVGKTGLPALEKTIQKIESAILKDSAPDFFHADFYYPGRSGPVKTVSDALYARVYSEMHRYVFQHLWKVFRHVLAGYGNLKRERKEISFSDIELILLETLKKDRIFTADVKKNKSYILIDEYQDTSDVQKEIFDALIYDEKGGLSMIPFIVGDPKQSIYGFRNANIEIFGKTKQELLKFREKYQTPVYRELDRNFRSGKKLLDDFNEIFADVFNNEKTEYRPSVTAGPACCSAGTAGTGSMGPQGVYFVRSEESHADEMMASASRKAACIIAGLVGSHGYRPGEILVLVRKKTRLPLLRECFDDILGRRGIPYFHVDSSNILDTKEIQDIIIYLQALENPHSNYYFLPLLKSPFFRKSDPEIISFLRDGQSLYDVLNSAGASAEMDLFNRIRLKKNRISISDLAGEIIERSGYFSFLSSLPCKKEATTNVLVFTDYLRRLQEMEMFNLTDLLYYIQEYGVSLSKPRVIGEKSDVVRVMTVHSSKGLESRAVIYLASSPGEGDPGAVIFSGSGSKAGMGMKLVKPDTNYFALAEDLKDAGAREEKRLAYVTFTRARELFYYI
ncbi:MAG: UvrD-helicase domain-containing protein, partial [Brevinematales bacterium]